MVWTKPSFFFDDKHHVTVNCRVRTKYALYDQVEKCKLRMMINIIMMQILVVVCLNMVVMVSGLMLTPSGSLARFVNHSVMRPPVLSRSSRRTLLCMEFDWKVAKKGAEEKMAKSLENMQSQFNTLRTGGANPALLDRVVVEYFGSITPLNQLARVAAAGSQQLVVEPFDRSVTKEIEVLHPQLCLLAIVSLTPSLTVLLYIHPTRGVMIRKRSPWRT